MVTLSKLAIGSGLMVTAVYSILKAAELSKTILQYFNGKSSSNEVEVSEANEVRLRRYRSKMIKIPQRSVGAVLGRGGANIRGIERETKTFIKVVHYGKHNCGYGMLANRIRPSQDDEDWATAEGRRSAKESEYAFVEIRGETEDNIKLAILEINSFVADSKIPRSTKIMRVPSHILGYVIGAGGSNVREIKRNHNVRIEIEPENGSITRTVTITGNEKSVALAEARINQLVSHHYSENPTDWNEEYEKQFNEMQRIREQLEEVEEEW